MTKKRRVEEMTAEEIVTQGISGLSRQQRELAVEKVTCVTLQDPTAANLFRMFYTVCLFNRSSFVWQDYRNIAERISGDLTTKTAQ